MPVYHHQRLLDSHPDWTKLWGQASGARFEFQSEGGEMITASQIAGLRTAASDYEKTEQLKAKLDVLRRERRPFYLTKADFDEILRWKLGG